MTNTHVPLHLLKPIACAAFALLLSPACFAQNQPQASNMGLDAHLSDLGHNLATPVDLQENAPTGAYGAPEWTTNRRFTTTRIYLQQAPWEVGFEQWWRGRYYKDGTAENKFEEEIELGLPYRFQLDLYENWVVDQDRHVSQDEISVELRYAFADWGKIPLNPTLYVEYAFCGQNPDTIETKLLLGDDFGDRWHWGANFSCEQEVTGAHSTELLFAQGISYTLIDQKLSAGVEMEFIHTTEHGSRGTPSVEFQMGPSIQWRPTAWSHLDVVPLIGMAKDSPTVEVFMVFGIDFGSVRPKQAGYTPAALGSH